MPEDDNIGLNSEDVANTSAQIENFKLQIKDATTKLKEFAEKGLTSGESVNSLKKTIENANHEISRLNLTLPFSQKIFESCATASKVLSQAFGPLGGMFSNVSSMVHDVVKSFQDYAGIASTSTTMTRNFINPLGELNTIIGNSDILKGLNEGLKNLLVVQDTARSSTVAFGQGIKTADKEAATYPQTLRLMASFTGITTKELENMNKEMSIIPGALSEVSGGFAGLSSRQSQTIQPTAILATTLKAFGISASEAAKIGVEGFLEFNQKVEETVIQLGKMAAASEETGIRRDIATRQITEASKGLAIFGQKTASAAETWTTFMRTLGDTVPINQVNKMVQSVVNSIASMSVENRAFIGMMSGVSQGRTALGGSLQLELAMRSPEGMQKNLTALTTTLGRFTGGRVITLEQAARNPQLEIQFQLQREMLGKITGITTREQQNRVLEVLQQVNRGGMSQLEGGKHLETAFEEGRSVQEKQLTSLERIEQHVATFSDYADKQLEILDNTLRTRNVATGTMERSGFIRSFANLAAKRGAETPMLNREIVPTFAALGTVISNSAETYKAGINRLEPTKTGAFTEILEGIRLGARNERYVPKERQTIGILPPTISTRARLPRILTPERVPTRVNIPRFENINRAARQQVSAAGSLDMAAKQQILAAQDLKNGAILLGKINLEKTKSLPYSRSLQENINRISPISKETDNRILQDSINKMLSITRETSNEKFSNVRNLTERNDNIIKKETPTTFLLGNLSEELNNILRPIRTQRIENPPIIEKAIEKGIRTEQKPTPIEGNISTIVLKIVGNEEKVKKEVFDTLSDKFQKHIIGSNY